MPFKDDYRNEDFGKVFIEVGRNGERHVRLNRNTHKAHINNESITWHLVIENAQSPDADRRSVVLTNEQMKALFDAWHVMLVDTIEQMEEGN